LLKIQLEFFSFWRICVVADIIFYHCYISLLFIIFLSTSNVRCLSVATRQCTTWLHHCSIFKCFNGKLLASPTSTRWAKNRSLWALFGGWCNILCHSSESQHLLHASCIIRTINENSVSTRCDVHVVPKQHCLLYAARCHRKFEILHSCNIVKNCRLVTN